jgi:hypothetical protein
MRRVFVLILCVMLCSILWLSREAAPRARAEDRSACRALAEEGIAAAARACAAAGADTACYGHTGVVASSAEGVALSNIGQIVPLARLQGLTTEAASLERGTWGIAVLNIQAGLPEGAAGVRAALFGDSVLTSAVRPEAAIVKTLPVRTFDDLPVLLRAGASKNFPQIARLTFKQEGAADARNAQSTWVRVRLGELVGWASVNQIRLDGDIESLPIRDERDILPDFLYTAPMQAITLSNVPPSGKPACSEAASGLLLQRSAETGAVPVRLMVNGVELSFLSATLALRAAPNDNLDVMVIDGVVTVRAFGAEATLADGEMLQVRIGGANGLTALAAPKEKTRLPFAAVEGVPLTLMPKALSCLAGVLPSDARVAARSGPSEKDFTSLFFMSPAQTYTVEGWNADSAGEKWWKLRNDKRAEHWVPQNAVRTVGACDALERVEVGMQASSGAAAGGVPGGGGFAPSTRTIWNAEVGPDQLIGNCKLGVLNYCAHMVAIAPNGSGLTYRGQEITPYNLTRIRENVYVYEGRNGLNNGRISLVLTFTSPTTYTLTQTLILDADPECQHVNVVNATLR